jgi:hypothetical protein
MFDWHNAGLSDHAGTWLTPRGHHLIAVGRKEGSSPEHAASAHADPADDCARRQVVQRPRRGSVGFVVGPRGMITARPWRRARRDSRPSHSDDRYLLEGRCRRGQPVAATAVRVALVLSEAPPPRPAVAPGAAQAPGSGAAAQRDLANWHGRQPQARTVPPGRSRAVARRLTPARSSWGCARPLHRGRQSWPSQSPSPALRPSCVQP